MSEKKTENILIRFLKFIFALVKVYFFSIGLFVTITPIMIFLLVSHLSTRSPDKVAAPMLGDKEKVVLEINLNGVLKEKTPDEAEVLMAHFFSGERYLSSDAIHNAIRRAKLDKRVQGILVKITDLQGGLSVIEELRKSFSQFKESKKPIFFHLESGDTSKYYLASVGEKISISPLAGLSIPGPAFQLVYLKSALRKVGIEFEVTQAGKYKSAMEALIADKPSSYTYEMYKNLEKSIRDHIIREIAKDRSTTFDQVDGWLKRSLFTSEEAKSSGLIDRVDYYQTVRNNMKTGLDIDSFISPLNYLNASEEIDEPFKVYTDEKIALIEAVGPIYNSLPKSSTDGIAADRLIKELRWARKDKDIKAVVMKISSPGGVASAADLIWDEVRKLALKKPVIVSMGNTAASGGYYIAAAATKIVANPTTITGSIGVIAGIPKASSFSDKWGINFYLITESERKDLLNIGTKMDDSDKDILTTNIKYTYKTFLNRIVTSREMSLEQVQKGAEGRVFSGLEAKALGLVDEIGNINDSMRIAIEQSGLDSKKIYEIARYRGGITSPLDCLTSRDKMLECVDELDTSIRVAGSQFSMSVSPLEANLREKLFDIKSLLDDSQVLTYWPEAMVQ